MESGMKMNAGGRIALVVLAAIAAMPAIAQSQSEPVSPPVSPTVLKLRQSYLDQPFSALTFRNMHQIYPIRTVPHAGEPWRIPRADHELDFTYQFDGKTLTPDEFIERTFTNALIIIKDGRIVSETYRNGSSERDRFVGFSMSKSITSLLVGAALEKGLITSLDDPVTAYLPELKGGGYDGVPIRRILQMRSGIYRNETYTPKDPLSQPPGSPMASLRDNVSRYVDAAPTVQRARAPGEKFDYMNLDTAVLGWLVERVSGNTIAGFASQNLWEPIGAESDAFFILDGEPGVGREFNVAGFNATARDWARVGLMMLNKGRANGRQVFSSEWIAASIEPVPTGRESEQGYGYQWWIEPDDSAFLAQGHMGQFLYVNPSAKTIVVKLSYFPPNTPELARESHAFFAAAAAWRPR